MRSLLIFSLFWLMIIGCTKEQPLIDPVPPDDEEEEEEEEQQRTYKLTSFDLGEYSIEVYYPSDYDSTRSYPVIYFNDGGLFADVFGLLTVQDADPFLMVGIIGVNPRAERFLPYLDSNLDDYTPGAEEYSAFIVEEIIPFVEGKYNINRSKRAMFGISFGGIHATWIGIRYPGVFSFIGALSPSFWVDNEAIFVESVSGLVQTGPSVPHRFYFDRGTSEWFNMIPFIAHLKSADLDYGKNIFYYEVRGAAHDTEFWALRIQIPFRLFMDGNPESEIRGLELQSYCIPDPPNPALPRLNPIISYNNGVILSVMTEATYKVIAGSGNVMQDGSYSVTSGGSMTVEVTYGGFSKTIELSSCE